jgi:hypothetical protein
VRAVIVVRREDRVSELPELTKRAQAGDADAKNSCVRTPVFARLISERDFLHPPAFGESLHENLLEHVEVSAGDSLFSNG